MKITKAQLKRLIKEELAEMAIPAQDSPAQFIADLRALLMKLSRGAGHGSDILKRAEALLGVSDTDTPAPPPPPATSRPQATAAPRHAYDYPGAWRDVEAYKE